MAELSGTRIDLTERAKALMALHNSVNAYFGPGTPPAPAWNEEAPRLYQYQPGVNLVTTPRAGYGVLPFASLRALAGASKEVRLNIEHIKRQMRGLEWEIVPAKEKLAIVAGQAYEAVVDIAGVQAFFEQPDGVHDFDSWLNMLLEELLVTDAVTLWPEKRGSRLTALEIIDGTTIRPLLDVRGSTPRPPTPAYLQVLHGMATSHYPASALIYAPLNTKVYTPYGESPIEWMLMSINTAIRHDLQRLGYFTEGNIPGVLVGVSPEWGTENIQVFQEYFDALAAGDINRANKIMFVPGSSANNVFPMAQNDVDKIDVDKWLMQIACWAFGNNPAEFGIVPGAGLGGAGFMEGAENMQQRSLIGPITGYLCSLFNRVIREIMHRQDVKFQWLGLNPAEDELKQAQVDQIYIGTVYSAEYVADRLGVPEQFRVKDAPMNGNGLVPMQGPISLPAKFLPYVKRALQSELTSWRGKAVRYFEKGLGAAPFESEVIPDELGRMIRSELERARSTAEIERLFNNLLDRDTALIKSMHEIVNDPVESLKAAAAGEMERALAEYFSGLQQRVMSAGMEHDA